MGTLGTSGVPPYMNDRNEDEVSRYIDPELCDYFVDMTAAEGKGNIVALRRRKWQIVAEAPFLDATSSRQPWRSFFVPGVSQRRNTYAQYRLMRRDREAEQSSKVYVHGPSA